MELIIAESKGDLANKAAEWITQLLERVVSTREHAAVALAGGSTPRPVYELLATQCFKQRIPWKQLDFYYGDERCVAPDHPESNYRMACEALFDRLPECEIRVHRMEAEDPDRNAAAERYAASLPDCLDLIILGMGTDGHTASLFPGSVALQEQRRKVVAVDGPQFPHQRLSVTPAVINAAAQRLLLVVGSDKAAMLARAFADPIRTAELPVQLARKGTWIIDRSAAAGLGVERSQGEPTHE